MVTDENRAAIACRDVGRVALGTAPFAFRDVDEQRAIEVALAALEAGVDLIDTALAYTRIGYESYAEQLVRKVLAAWRGDCPLVATKGGHWRQDDLFPIDASPAALRSHCETSLRSLGVERIDLYQLHHVDPAVPLEDSVGALADLRTEGKIAHIGLSNVSIEQIELAQVVTPLASVQNRFSFDAQDDLRTVRYCEEQGLAYLAYMPLGGGAVSTSDAYSPVRRRAAELGISPQRAALRWVLSASPAIVALVGATRSGSIRDSVRALSDRP